MSQVVYLSDGRMHLVSPGSEPRPLESRYAEQIRERAIRAVEKNAWKVEGFSARFQGRRPQVTDPELLVSAARVSSVGPGSGVGDVLYTLHSGDVSGLFALQSGEERRLFHGSGDVVNEPAAHPSAEFIACSVARRGQVSNIAVLHADGTGLAEVTDGDSQDRSPAWVPGQPSQLLYSSAGVARDRAGRFAGLGPSSIQRIDFSTRKVETVREEPGRDLLAPRALADGTLLYIRRPWREATRGAGPLRLLLGIALIPWNLLRAVWGWLSLFSLRYSGRPLIKAGTPDEEKQNLRDLLVMGNMLDATRDGARAEDKPLAPASWELIKRAPSGAEEVLARSVWAFDAAGDSIVYCDGAAAYELRGRQRTRLARGRVEAVAILRG